MDQSENHLRVLNAMGIQKIIIVVTKSDIADKSRVTEVSEYAVEAVFEETGVRPASIVVSAITGSNIEKLKSLILDEIKTLPQSKPGEPFLYVDRVFTVKGSGLVITGSLRGGVIKKNDKYFSSIELCKKMGYSFVVRIREKEGGCVLTVKSAKKKIDGVWEEYETAIEKPKTYLSMLKLIGLEKVIDVEKKRASFKLDGFTINVDEFRKWGSFVEIELISSKYKNKKGLFNLANKLGIAKENIFEKGYISTFLKELNSPFAKYIKN